MKKIRCSIAILYPIGTNERTNKPSACISKTTDRLKMKTSFCCSSARTNNLTCCCPAAPSLFPLVSSFHLLSSPYSRASSQYSESDPRSHSLPSSPLPTTVIAFIFILRIMCHFLPSFRLVSICVLCTMSNNCTCVRGEKRADVWDTRIV